MYIAGSNLHITTQFLKENVTSLFPITILLPRLHSIEE